MPSPYASFLPVAFHFTVGFGIFPGLTAIPPGVIPANTLHRYFGVLALAITFLD